MVANVFGCGNVLGEEGIVRRTVGWEGDPSTSS
jgi:hypothetical protein